MPHRRLAYLVTGSLFMLLLGSASGQDNIVFPEDCIAAGTKGAREAGFAVCELVKFQCNPPRFRRGGFGDALLQAILQQIKNQACLLVARTRCKVLAKSFADRDCKIFLEFGPDTPQNGCSNAAEAQNLFKRERNRICDSIGV